MCETGNNRNRPECTYDQYYIFRAQTSRFDCIQTSRGEISTSYPFTRTHHLFVSFLFRRLEHRRDWGQLQSISLLVYVILNPHRLPLIPRTRFPTVFDIP